MRPTKNALLVASAAVLLAACSGTATQSSSEPSETPSASAGPGTPSSAPSAAASAAALFSPATSPSGAIHGTVTPSVMPPPIGELHSWTLHIEDASGAPIENATVTVVGDMPAHGHGLG
ncbi:MAG TPA: hypothetical protein VIA02_00620, partial [Candidatus Limnocylindria bacterium]